MAFISNVFKAMSNFDRDVTCAIHYSLSETNKTNGQKRTNANQGQWFEQCTGTCQCLQTGDKQSGKALLSAKWQQTLYLFKRWCHGEDSGKYGIIAQ